MGSGHGDPSVTSVVSPGPAYDTRDVISGSKQSAPSYSIRGGRMRDDPGSPVGISFPLKRVVHL